MPPLTIALVLLIYFALLYVVAYVTGRKANNASYFKANKSASWLLVAFGMIGTSLSGVTFVSVPGTVSNAGFQYFTLALGFFLGYFVVAFVLLPLYYRLNLIPFIPTLITVSGNQPIHLEPLFLCCPEPWELHCACILL